MPNAICSAAVWTALASLYRVTKSAAQLALVICLTPLATIESRLTGQEVVQVPPQAIPDLQSSQDTRYGPLAGESGDFLPTLTESTEAWEQRRKQVRQIMQVGLGLWPKPSKTPLNAVVRDKLDQGDYTIEKVYFESLPGFFVTGSLYRPKGKSGRQPVVLSPHGHFPGGRFQDIGAEEVRWQIARGAERFEDGGRSFMQSRNVQLARMGCIVFHYDMIGYADSLQLSMELVHRFSAARHEQTKAPEQGFYSAEAELRLQNVMGLHTYNSQRALDFVLSLPDVDPRRIAVTGGSGGGTQTFMLCAIDDRPLVSVPVVILSADRQGGCTCENICGLRIGTNNLDFTSLHAPKPLLIVSADDASRTMPQRGFPELRELYQLLGGESNLEHVPLLHFPHNYNYVSRTAMYHFLNKHLQLGLAEPILERPYERLTREQLSVWDDDHRVPPSGREFELQLLDWLTQDADQQLQRVVPTDAESLARFRESVGTAWDIVLRKLPEKPGFKASLSEAKLHDSIKVTLGTLEYRTVEGHNAALPFVQLDPDTPPKKTVIVLDVKGQAAVWKSEQSTAGITAEARQLLTGGARVIGVDLFKQGGSAEQEAAGRQPYLSGEQAHCGWTYCYNLPVFCKRMHDALAVIEANSASVSGQVMHQDSLPITVLARGPAAIWAAAAIAQSDRVVAHAALDTQGFRFAKLTDVYDINFLPGSLKYGDVPGLLALLAPTKLTLAGESSVPEMLSAAYAAAGSEQPALIRGEELAESIVGE